MGFVVHSQGCGGVVFGELDVRIQSLQCFAKSSMSALIFGYHKCIRASTFIHDIPGCVQWSSSSKNFRNDFGMTTRKPHIMILPSTKLNSSLITAYGLHSGSTFCGHESFFKYFTMRCNTQSFSVSSLMSSTVTGNIPTWIL